MNETYPENVLPSRIPSSLPLVIGRPTMVLINRQPSCDQQHREPPTNFVRNENRSLLNMVGPCQRELRQFVTDNWRRSQQ